MYDTNTTALLVNRHRQITIEMQWLFILDVNTHTPAERDINQSDDIKAAIINYEGNYRVHEDSNSDKLPRIINNEAANLIYVRCHCK